ncbi:MAG: ATP-binding protein [bacterium]|nr:ATP-binding protein [bacterium]
MNIPFLNKPKIKEESVNPKLTTGLVSVQDVIAPPAIEVDFNNIKIGQTYFRSMFIAGYPRFVSANWLAPLINFNHSLDISMFVYPVESKEILNDLKRKIAEMEATIESDIKRGKVIDPGVQVALDDALALQEQLAKGAEKFFQFGLYITIMSESLDELDQVTKEVNSTLGALLIISKPATLQMEDGFKTTLPTCLDKLMITRNMDTTSLATTFPFTSSELTANEGVMYGINEHNDSLIIFDRFTLENANEVVLGKSGSGKSFLVKLEALRSLMFGTDVIIIDPEEEYKNLCVSVGGDFVSFGFSSNTYINPFELSGAAEGESTENELQIKIGFTLARLLKIMVETKSAEEDAVIHNALEMTYRQKGITYDNATHKNEPPLLEDLYKVLIGMENPMAQNIALRLEKFVKGSFGQIFNRKSTVSLKNPFTVFSFRDLEDQMRSLAIFVIVDYIWAQIRRNMKKRILIVDEAWYLMKNQSSAEFLWSFAKRARKYYLGLTTITQDVEDFMATDLGKTIVTNSSIQMLMKQSPASIDHLAGVFYLSEGEKSFLLSTNVGEGLFFAGSSHVAMRVVSSPDEYKLITTKPQEVQAQNEAQTPTVEDLLKVITPPESRQSP